MMCGGTRLSRQLQTNSTFMMNVLREKRVRKEQKLENKKKEEKERKKGNFKIVMIILRAFI